MTLLQKAYRALLLWYIECAIHGILNLYAWNMESTIHSILYPLSKVNTMGRVFDITCIGEAKNHGYGFQYTMDGQFDIPWVGMSNAMDRGFDTPWIVGTIYYE
jgi:hypothetical protein